MWRVNRSPSKGFSEVGYTGQNIPRKNLLNKPQWGGMFIEEGGYTERDFQVPTDLTEPQGKLKNVPKSNNKSLR